MKTEEKTPDNSIMQEFLDAVEIRYEIIAVNESEDEISRILKEAHADWIEHYNHADLTPLQARELANIYVHLHFAQQRYLRLNKEWIKYK